MHLTTALVALGGASFVIGSEQTVQLSSALYYTVALSGGKVSGCDPLKNMLSNRGCDDSANVQDLWYVDDTSRNQYYRFVPVPGEANTFNVITSCQKYLSCQPCSGTTTVDLWGVDDGSGRQRFLLTPVAGEANTYTFQVAGGRDASCGIYVSTGALCNDTYVNLWTSDDGSGRQRWVLNPVPLPAASLPLEPFQYQDLPLGAVKPTANSWLMNQLETQANGLHGHLYDFYNYVQQSEWIGGNQDYSNLGEAGSYWLNGVVPLAFQLNDQRLLGQVGYWINYIIENQGSDGWIGPSTSPRTIWGRFPAMLAMMQYAQANATAAPTIVNSMQKFVLLVNEMLSNGGQGWEEWGQARWQDLALVVEWLIDYYPNGQESTYLNLLQLLRYGGVNWKLWFSSGTFPTSAVNTALIPAHGVNNGQALKSEAVAYRFSHDSSDLDSTRSRSTMIDQYHGRASGIFGCDEHLAGLHPSRGSELCTVVETMYSNEYAYQVAGDNSFADKVEQLAYNALPGTLMSDMWEHQYCQQSNQIWSENMNPSVFATDGGGSNIFGLQPNYPCCAVNHGQGWPKFVSHAYMTLPDSSTLYHVLLSPTTVTTTLSNNNAVTVSAQTNYPFNSNITYSTTASSAFKFGIRVPGWVSSRTITYSVDDGSMQTATANSAGYIIINVSSGSHTIHVNIPMSIQTQSRYNGATAVTRGPLTYSLDIKFSTTVLATYALSSQDLQLNPVSAWQYAIDTSSLSYNGDATSLAQYVWSETGSPVSISASVCPISWNVVTNAADTPPTSPASCTGNSQIVKLLPYGAAKLRITEMPSF